MKRFRINRTHLLKSRLAATLLTTCSFVFAEDAAVQDSVPEKTTPQAVTTDEPASTSESSEEDLKTARLHFANGVELIQASPPNYQDAYRQFELALEKSGRSWKVLGNLGLCALKLERDGEALALYGEYLEKGTDEVTPAERKEIERELLLIKGNMATVRLSSSEPDARISVKRQGSNIPTQLYSLENGKVELGLRSGSMTIVAKAGGRTREWTPVLSAEEEASYHFDFETVPQAAPESTQPEQSAPAAATSASPEDVSSSSFTGTQIAGFATAGAGVLALGAGAFFGISGKSKESDARDSCIDGICPESTEKDIDDASNMTSMANIFYIAGGVLAATGVTLVIVGADDTSAPTHATQSRPTLSLGPALSPTNAGFFASGTF